MIENEDKLEECFRMIHDISDESDVRVIHDTEGCCDVIAVGLFKDDRLCWSSTVAEIAFDLAVGSFKSRGN